MDKANTTAIWNHICKDDQYFHNTDEVYDKYHKSLVSLEEFL